MTDTPQQASVSPMAMAIAESAARQFFERQYILAVEENVQLQKRVSEKDQEIQRLQELIETPEETEEPGDGE